MKLILYTGFKPTKAITLYEPFSSKAIVVFRLGSGKQIVLYEATNSKIVKKTASVRQGNSYRCIEVTGCSDRASRSKHK